MKKQWKRLAALSSAVIMAAGTLLYFPTDTLQNISWGITASAEETGAETWNEGNLTWTLTADGTMTISGSGAMKGYSWYSGSPATQKKDNVKKVVIEDGVTSIGDFAFFYCSSLTSIEIPSGVTSIGKNAFQYCSSLTSIEIPESVISIGNNTFEHCSSLTNITIPGSVTSIGEGAFRNCIGLTSISIPKSVTSIGNFAFYNCTDLTSINIPGSVTSIGDYAFDSCSSLTSITIPKSVTSIGNFAFYGCGKLTVYLENGSTLTSGQLGVDASKIAAYWNEDNLTWTLDADGTLTISGTGPMRDYFHDSPATQKKDSVERVVIEDGVTSIGIFAFQYCRRLTNITIPESVTSIGDSAFRYCSSLTSITIPESVTSIGNAAFSDTPWLTNKQQGNSPVIVNGILIDGTACSGEVTIPEGVTSIGDFAFSGCSSMTSITIPDSVTSIGDRAFQYCTNLSEIVVPNSITHIGGQAFAFTAYANDGINWDENILYLGSYLIEINYSDSDVYNIKNGTKVIADYAFYGCEKQSSITIPSSVIHIGIKNDVITKQTHNIDDYSQFIPLIALVGLGVGAAVFLIIRKSVKKHKSDELR